LPGTSKIREGPRLRRAIFTSFRKISFVQLQGDRLHLNLGDPMSEIDELRQRLQILEDIEAIRQTKYDYFHALDLKHWDELGDCFTQDIVAEYGRPDWHVEGRQNLVDWLRSNEGGDNYAVSHSSHNPQIRILGPDRATGFFKLHDWVIIEPSITLKGWGHYSDEFTKDEDGRWRIDRLMLDYVYKEEHYVYRGNYPPPMTPALSK
jgi:hypothetical protein